MDKIISQILERIEKVKLNALGQRVISREEFIIPNQSKRDYNKQMGLLDQAMKKLVIDGYLTPNKSGDYWFFRHRGRQFPKLWIVK